MAARSFSAILGLLALTAQGQSEDIEGEKGLHMALDLVDNSHVIGRSTLTHVPVRTPYVHAELPLRHVRNISLHGDHDTATFTMRNGDRLTGALALPPIELNAIFGSVAIDVQHVTEINIFGGDLALEGLIFHLSFERDNGGRAIDRSGFGNDGAIQGAGWMPKGRMGSAMSFDGQDDQVICGRNGILEMGTSGWTISVWVRTTDNRRFNGIINAWSGSGYRDQYHLTIHENSDLYRDAGPGKATFVIYEETAKYGVSSKTSVADGRWHLITAVRDAEKLCMYVDGKLENTNTWPSSHISLTAPLTVGSRTTNSGFYHGDLDEAMIFHRALAPGEIRTIFSRQGGGNADP
jgi:hypothetical protein